MNNDYLLLKWGTVKGWNFENTDSEAFNLLRKYMKSSPASGCMTDHPNDERKKILCDIIDKMDGEIQNDWTGDILSKEDAKKYVMEYK